jgi:hypothetical protein
VSPVVSTETLTELEADIVPDPGVTNSHGPPDVVAGVAVKASPKVPPMATDCATGAVPPIWKAKLSGVGVAVMVGLVTTNVTLITCDVAPVDATVTVPL